MTRRLAASFSLAAFVLLDPSVARVEGPGIAWITGRDATLPELADPYVTSLGDDSFVVSGTAPYHLAFPSLEAMRRGESSHVVWNDFHYPDGTPMEGGRTGAHSWDMKPTLWSRSLQGRPRIWEAARDSEPPLVVWYGGRMRPRSGQKTSQWPDDNYSRDVFAFVERGPGKWFSLERSIFSGRENWPRKIGDFKGHRYGHQIVMGADGAVVFYEEVTRTRESGWPAVTTIFMDRMASPFQAGGRPVELISPTDPVTGKFYPSTVREDGSALVEGPLYFRFQFEGEAWEAIGFSAGSYYGRYPACFASRKVSDGLRGKPYLLDLNDDGTDLHDAGAELGRALRLRGGPGRPSVIVRRDGQAIQAPQGGLQILFHGYRPGEAYRVTMYAILRVGRGQRGGLRFEIAAPGVSAL